MAPTNPRTRDGSIARVRHLFDQAGVKYRFTGSGRDIRFQSPAGEVKINHNGRNHWTMRIPGMAKDGIRFNFNVTMVVDPNLKLIMFNDTMAIKYE